MTKVLGVLGGMGPAASAEFMVRLIQQTPAKKDQDHIPTILWSDPRIPDRSTALRRGTDEPLEWLQKGVQGLINAGCTYIVMPCNTSHFWFHELKKFDVNLIHIVDSVADALRSVNVTQGTIGVMGTQATVELGLYQYRLNKLGWNCITPSTKEMDTLVQPAIDLIKANNLTDAEPMLLQVTESLIQRGACAVVLGCTEIPLAVRQEEFSGVPLVNSIDSLVKSAIKEFKRIEL
jgi:aspartate racemase